MYVCIYIYIYIHICKAFDSLSKAADKAQLPVPSARVDGDEPEGHASADHLDAAMTRTGSGGGAEVVGPQEIYTFIVYIYIYIYMDQPIHCMYI